MTDFTLSAHGPVGPPGQIECRFGATGYSAGSTSARYLLPFRGDDVVSTTEWRVACPLTGTIKTLKANVVAAFSSGTCTVTVLVNGADTALTCTIGASGTDAADTTHEVAITAGQDVSVKIQTSASVTSTNTPRVDFVIEEAA